MSIPRFFLVCIALLWLNVAMASPPLNDQATNRAFNALLSMPQAQPPQNNWNVEAPSGYNGTSEDDLIAWLARQKRDGADLNAYRHYGTLLQHAIRSKMPKVAHWLLAHGADPTLPVKNDVDDALSIALQDHQWSMVEALLATTAFRHKPPQQLVAHYLPYAPDALPEMVKHGFAMPSGTTARCLLQNALVAGNFKLALLIPAKRPLARNDADATGQSLNCNARPLRPGSSSQTRFSELSASLLERLDAKLAAPLLPYLLSTLQTPRDVQGLLALPLRNTKDNDRLFAQWAIPKYPVWFDMPFAVSEALLRQLPPGQLDSMLDDGKTLGSWLHIARRSSKQDYIHALNQVPPSALSAHPASAINPLYESAKFLSQTGDVRVWKKLLARPELRLDGADIPSLLSVVPTQLWPQLFAHGYRLDGPHSDVDNPGGPNETILWLRSTNAQAIKQHWPLLVAQDPSLVDRSIPGLLRPCMSKFDLQEIRLLVSLGAKPHAIPLPAPSPHCTKQDVYSQLLALGIITRPDADAPKRLVYEPMQCQFNADDHWLKALTGPVASEMNDEEAAITSIQLIDVPGQTACAVMVTGGDGVHEVSFDNGSFYYGPAPSQYHCGDPSPWRELVWTLHQDHLEKHDVHAQTSGLLPLRDRTNNRRYYLAYLPTSDRCGALPGMTTLLTWTKKPPYRLVKTDRASPTVIALSVQCQKAAKACFDIQGYNVQRNTSTSKSLPRDAPRDTQAFINQFFAAQRSNWIDATVALDTGRLRQLEADGAPAFWMLAGINAVTHSTLPQTERRQRTAWLFRDHVRLLHALGGTDYTHTRDTVFGLDNWLPREDWRPLLNALKKVSDAGAEDSDYTLLQRLADEAKEHGKSRLACRLLHADGKMCSTAPAH